MTAATSPSPTASSGRRRAEPVELLWEQRRVTESATGRVQLETPLGGGPLVHRDGPAIARTVNDLFRTHHTLARIIVLVANRGDQQRLIVIATAGNVNDAFQQQLHRHLQTALTRPRRPATPAR